MRNYEDIIRLVRQMEERQGPMLRLMQQILTRYDGDYIVPFPQLPNEPSMSQLTPALIGEAVDFIANRASSVRPNISSPALDPTIDVGARSRARAQTRRQIITATYDKSKWILGRRRYYKHLAAYNTSALFVVPDFDMELPRLEVRNPLATYSEDTAAEELRPPMYVAFITQLSGARLRAQYPRARAENGGPITRVYEHEMWEVVEWIDEEQTLFGLLGPVNSDGMHISSANAVQRHMQLSPSYRNKLGIVPAVVPHNVSLGKIASRLGSMIGNVDLQAKLTMLDIAAQERAIFPDTYIIGREAARPQIIGNRWKDGREGDINLLQDVEQIGALRTTPDGRTNQIIDRLERAVRTGTGLVPQAGGETYGALRTGRGIDALAGMALDPRVQELHEISEAWMPHVNEAILRTWETYWPSKKVSMYSTWTGDVELVEFQPKRDIEGVYANGVSYGVPGADVVQQTQILGSLFGAGLISRKTVREKHPWIQGDPEGAARAVVEEQFEDALKEAIVQQLMQGQLPPMVAVLMRDAMNKGADIFEAVRVAEEEAQRRQATAAPAPPPDAGMVAPPESMPGLAAGPGALQQPEPTPRVQVPPDAERMRQLIQTMGA